MTIDEARAIYLSFPDAVESSHMGHPDFRIKNKIFASLWPDRDQGVLRLPSAMAEALIADRSDTFLIRGRSGSWIWMGVQLALIGKEEFQDLAHLAFEQRC